MDTSVVWVHISNLRKRLQALDAQTTIKAMRGLGYRLVAQEASTARNAEDSAAVAAVNAAEAKTGSGADYAGASGTGTDSGGAKAGSGA